MKLKPINSTILRIGLTFDLISTFGPALNFYDISIPLFGYLFRIAIVLYFIFVIYSFFQKRLTVNFLLIIFGLYLLYLAIFNFNGKNFEYGNYQPDLFAHLRFYIFLLLGYNMQYINVIKSFLLKYLRFALIINFFSIIIHGNFLRSEGNLDSLAYEVQYMLTPSLFFIFMLKNLSKNDRIVVIASFILFFIEQILFQKRLPIAKMLFIIFLLSYFYYRLPIYSGKFTIVFVKYFKYAIVASIIFFGLLIFKINIGTYISATADRFYVQDKNIQRTIEKDARWEIGRIALSDLTISDDLIFGRGFGGVIYSNLYHGVSKDNQRYRSETEMAVPTILLKGGVILLLFLIYFFIKALLAYSKAKKTVIAIAFWVFVFVYFVFAYGMGYISNNSDPSFLILAYSIGYLNGISKL